MSVSVATGQAQVEGFFYENDSALALTIATAHATLGRIDTVVVRLDRTANSAVLAVVTGTAAASPVAPTLSATDSLYELPLANVQVDPAVGVITAGKVTDRRVLTKNLTEVAASAAYVVRSEVKQATLAAAESTTSASFTDLATVGPAVTVTVGPSGAVLVIVGCHLAHSAAGGEAIMSVALTGAHTSAASVVQAVMHRSDSAGQPMQASRLFSLTGLTPGAVTFTAKYRIDNAAGTATFQARHLAVIPL